MCSLVSYAVSALLHSWHSRSEGAGPSSAGTLSCGGVDGNKRVFEKLSMPKLMQKRLKLCFPPSAWKFNLTLFRLLQPSPLTGVRREFFFVVWLFG